MLEFRTKGVYEFDRRALSRGFKKDGKSPLKKAGAFIRREARSSIRRGKKYSQPGKPPKSRAPGDPIKLILFDVQDSRVVVGAVKLSHTKSSLPVPGLHEHSGWVPRKITINPQERKRQKKLRRTASQKAAYAKLLKSGRLKAKAREKKQTRIETVHYEKRPFMLPALIKVRKKLPGFWKGSIGE